ncbi:ABC transporter substrate-binding protein [Ensifer sp. ENS05]|nr:MULTISPECIES: ABC transporter substrate-binding protein [unclassified Ensifer]MBD9595179.1 ABC transporter substrate-binding protein [Ensifer sp. ENS05]SDM33651.1 trehalose/maltose transport system substrate-binding protein [Ensifer sp. YR511]
MRWMKCFKAAAMAGVAFAAMPAAAAEVSIFCSSAGAELELCQSASEAWAKETGNTVKINKMPANWGEALPLYQQLLAGKSGDVDVLTLDNIWVGTLAPHLVDLREKVPADEVSAHFESSLADATIGGKLLAMPWFVDAGLMFYRKDLLEKYGKGEPKTWQELTETAKFIQDKERAGGSPDMWGYVWQGRAYEGLICDALEWVASFGGGNFISPDGTITANNPEAVKALDLARSWIGNISPEGVLNYDEEGSRGVFEAGNSVFHRNWSYVWGTTQAEDSSLRGKIGVMALPVGAEGQKSSGCYGAGLLGVSKYADDVDAAVSLVRYLTGAKEQKRRALQAYSPTLKALYEDKDILAANPSLAFAEKAYAESASRPSQVTGASYNRVSQRIFNGVHNVLSGKESAADALVKVSSDLERLKARGW